MNIIQAITELKEARKTVDGMRVSFGTMASLIPDKRPQTLRRWIVGEAFPIRAFHPQIIKLAKKLKEDVEIYRTPAKERQ